MLQNTVVAQWVIFAITLLIGILGLVATFMQAGNYTAPSIIMLAVAILQLVLTQITAADKTRIEAQFKRLSAKK